MALREDDEVDVDARSEPILAIVIVAGMAGILLTPAWGTLLDEESLDWLVLAVVTFIGGLLYEAGDFKGAVRCWQTLLDRHAQDAYVRTRAGRIHRSMGYAYVSLRDATLAARAFLDALDIDPDDRDARDALRRLAAGP